MVLILCCRLPLLELLVVAEMNVRAREVRKDVLDAAIELSRLRQNVDAVAEEERIVGRLDGHTPAHEEAGVTDQHCQA